MTDSEGNIVWKADYNPFGGLATLTGTEVNNFRFPGQYYDSETGLHYNWHRYYNPETGRYIRTDPLGFDGGDLNLYQYARANPVMFTDPMGLRVSICARKLGDRYQPQVSPSGNPLRHDYLLINSRVRSFQAGDSIFGSQGWVDNNEATFNPKCELICDDPAFDKYVLDAANYNPQFHIFAYPSTQAYSMGYRNCQTWAREVIERAKQEYLKNECPKCFN